MDLEPVHGFYSGDRERYQVLKFQSSYTNQRAIDDSNSSELTPLIRAAKDG